MTVPIPLQNISKSTKQLSWKISYHLAIFFIFFSFFTFHINFNGGLQLVWGLFPNRRSWKHQWRLIFIAGRCPLVTLSTMAAVCGMGELRQFLLGGGSREIPEGAIKPLARWHDNFYCGTRSEEWCYLSVCLCHSPYHLTVVSLLLALYFPKVTEERVYTASFRILNWSNFLRGKLTERRQVLEIGPVKDTFWPRFKTVDPHLKQSWATMIMK